MPTLCLFGGGGGSSMKFVSSATAPLDTSGRTVWFNTTNNHLYFYSNGEWRAINTYN